MGLITAQEIKTNTSMGGNVDPDKFMHLLNDVQVMVLEPALGTKLYDKIITDFNEGGTNNLAGDYLTMFNDYIKPVLWHSVFAEYLHDANVMARNGGVFQHTPQDGTPADIEALKYVAKSAQSKADVYLERLKRFLCDQNIAEYDNAQDNDFDIDPQDVTTVSGWYFGSESKRLGETTFRDFIE